MIRLRRGGDWNWVMNSLTAFRAMTLTMKSTLQSNHYLTSFALDSILVFLQELDFDLEQAHLNIFHFHEPYFTWCPAFDDLVPETLTFVPCQKLSVFWVKYYLGSNCSYQCSADHQNMSRVKSLVLFNLPYSCHEWILSFFTHGSSACATVTMIY
ncbi:hypothetical protein D5086_012228 [Populus alba]|uniref:Uncharacterized protein n=3 Tax=Populus TaxID=3689 RepID=A0ACC4C1V6_POPAL|nr:hypothetical protein NC653_015726 [Populus alba x Populus x berolinensis]TKR98372.1 hypothetical protein D5086_0000205070 [Populus alba]